MSAFDFDLFVIGGGSAGVRAARISANHGARVGLAEEYRMGGTCVIRGCVPKKLLVYASHFSESFEDAAGYGWHVSGAEFSWPKLIANKDHEITRLEAAYTSALTNAKVEIFKSRAVLTDRHHVQLAGGRSVSADTILIATGGTPVRPAGIPGLEHGFTSNEAFHLPEMPRRVVILGGGYVAVEFAGIFNGLGAHVTDIYRGPALLRGFDADLRRNLMIEMARRGIDIRIDTGVQRIEKDGHLYHLMLSDGTSVTADGIMVALGRKPNVAGLGLEHAGVAARADGAIIVDDYSRTNISNIYAVGDVTDRLLLTPVAIAEGHAFADSVFGNRPRKIDYRNIATAVFSTPNIGTVGLSEETAIAEGHAVDVYVTQFRPMLHTMTGKEERVMMKLVIDASTDRVLGCHILGESAGEMVQCLAIAVKMGATKADFDATIPVHPTAAEELVTLRTKTRSSMASPAR